MVWGTADAVPQNRLHYNTHMKSLQVQKISILFLHFLVAHTFFFAVQQLWSILTSLNRELWPPGIISYLLILLIFFVLSAMYFWSVFKKSAKSWKFSLIIGAVGVAWLIINMTLATWPPLDRLFTTHLHILTNMLWQIAKYSALIFLSAVWAKKSL